MADLVANLKIDTSQFTSSIERAIQETKKFTTNLDKIGDGASTKGASTSINSLTQSLDKADKEALKLAKDLDRVGKEAQSAGSKAKQGFGSFADALTGGLVGGGIAVLGSQLASLATQGLQAVIDKGSAFEQSLSAVGAIVGQTGKPLEELGDKARTLAIRFGTDATDQLSAFQTVLSKIGPSIGDNAPALEKFAGAANTLAKAAGIDAATATNNLVDSMLQLGLVTGDSNKDADNAVFLINQLAKSAQVGAAEIPQVAEALLQVGTSSKLLNQSTDSTIAAIQVLAQGGKVGSEAGVAYRNVLSLMVKSSGEGDKAFAKLGTSTAELGKLLTDNKSPEQALLKIKAGLEGIQEPSEKAALLMKIFGAENSAAAGILLEGVGSFKEFQTGILAAQDGAGSAFDQAKQQMATFQQTAKQASATLSDVAISAFQKFQSVLGGLFEGESIDFEGIASGAKEFIDVLGDIGAVVGRVSQLFNFLPATFKLVKKIFDDFTEALGTGADSGTSFGATLIPILDLVGVQINLLVEVVSLAMGAIATIFGSVFGSITGSYEQGNKGTVNFSDKIIAFAKATTATIEKWSKDFNAFMTSIKPVLSDVGRFVGEIAKIIGTVLKGAFDIVAGAVTAVINVFKFFADTITTVNNAISSFVTSIFGAGTATVKTGGQVKQSTGFFANIGKEIQKAGGFLNYFTAILAGASEVFSNFATNVSDGLRFLSEGEFQKGFDALKASVMNSATSFTNGFNKSIKASDDALKNFNKEAEKTALGLESLNLTKPEAPKIMSKEDHDKLLEEARLKEERKNETEEQKKAREKREKEAAKNAKIGGANRSKEEKTELAKRLEEFKKFNESLTDVSSEYYNNLNLLENDFTLTTEEQAKKRAELEKALNLKRVKGTEDILKATFKDGKIDIGILVKETESKDEAVKVVDAILKEQNKLQTEANRERSKRQIQFYDALGKAEIDKQKDTFKEAQALSKLNIGDVLTTNLINALGLEGVKVGDKLKQSDFKTLTDNLVKSLENQLSDVDFELSQKITAESRKSLIEQRKAIQDELDGIKIRAIIEVPAPKGSVFADFITAFSTNLQSAEFKFDTKTAQDAVKDIQKRIQELDRELAKGGLTGEEYQQQIGLLKAEEASALESIPSVLEQTLNRISLAFDSARTSMIALAQTTAESLRKINKELSELPKDTELYTAKLGEQTKKQEELYFQLGSTLGAVLGSALTTQEDKGKAFLSGLFDLVSTAVSVLLPLILATYSAFSTPPFGPALAGLVTASIVAMLAGAKAALGFEKGGLVPGGEKLVRINEKGQEYVINANATKRNKGVLDALNKGNDRQAYELLTSRFGGGGYTVNNSSMELVAIKKEINLLRNERLLSRTQVSIDDVLLRAKGSDMIGVIRKANKNSVARR